MKNYENELRKIFGSKKFEGLYKTIDSYIDRLHFAREMYSLFMWQEIEREVLAFCRELISGRYYTRETVNQLYNFIMEQGKKGR